MASPVVGIATPTLICQRCLPDVLPGASEEDRTWVARTLASNLQTCLTPENLATFLLLSSPQTQTGRYAQTWQRRLRNAIAGRQVDALEQLLQEGNVAFVEGVDLPEVQAILKTEYEEILGKLRQGWTANQPQNLRYLPEKTAPRLIFASDQPPGCRMIHRYAYEPLTLMTALAQKDGVNPATNKPFAPSSREYLQTKYASQIKMCQRAQQG